MNIRYADRADEEITVSASVEFSFEENTTVDTIVEELIENRTDFTKTKTSNRAIWPEQKVTGAKREDEERSFKVSTSLVTVSADNFEQLRRDCEVIREILEATSIETADVEGFNVRYVHFSVKDTVKDATLDIDETKSGLDKTGQYAYKHQDSILKYVELGNSVSFHAEDNSIGLGELDNLVDQIFADNLLVVVEDSKEVSKTQMETLYDE